MKKLVSELKRGDKIELLYGEVGIVQNVWVDENIPQHTTINYQDGSRTFVLPDDEVEVLEIRRNGLNQIIKPFDGIPNSKDKFIEFTKTGDTSFTRSNEAGI